MSGQHKKQAGQSGTLSDIWKRMWPAALLLYASYFFYRWIGVYTAGVMGRITDLLLYKSGAGFDRGLLLELAGAFLLALLLMPAMDLVTNVILFRMSLRYEASVVDRVFRKDYETFLKQQDQWMGRIARDPLQYRQMAVVIPVRLLADGTVLVVAVAAMLRSDLFLALLLTVGTWLCVLVRLLCRKMDNQFLEGNRRYQDGVKERQIQMVRERAFWVSYGCRKSLPEQMEARLGRFYREVKKPEASVTAAVDLVQKGLNAALFLAALFYGLGQVEKGRMGAGDFIVVYFLVVQVRAMAESIVENFRVMKGYGAQQTRMEELTGGVERQGGRKECRWESLSFRKLSYTYPGTETGMPEQDFVLKRGESVMLMGENGSGKTTLLRLLSGLFPGKNGEIRIDNRVSLEEVNLEAWRAQIGFVQQFPDIFPGTVRENVRIGGLDTSEEQLNAVMERMGLTGLADRELRGAREELSGGEIKRIELARLLLRMEHCSLLMMDEPFENLDGDRRKVVHEILESPGKARILVSHGRK